MQTVTRKCESCTQQWGAGRGIIAQLLESALTCARLRTLFR